jgi:hypothetical protein
MLLILVLVVVVVVCVSMWLDCAVDDPVLSVCPLMELITGSYYLWLISAPGILTLALEVATSMSCSPLFTGVLVLEVATLTL